ncbi:MAG: heme lyase CcmF/NrfE family subunit [Gammaproteobacteria bacterium]
MIPAIGHFALILAFCIAVVQSIFSLIPKYNAIAKPAAIGQFVFLGFSFLCLTYAFITNDFSVAYVANNSNTYLPLMYRISAVWGAHEGSLLLWVLMLSGWSAAVAILSKNLPDIFRARVLSILGMVTVGFIWFLLATSNPFLRLLPNIPIEGRDLNPLLQDPGLIFHPPMLYMGYVGFAVAFAFALAALLSGRMNAAWVRWVRPWTMASWCFLTLGITLGSWWAYRELGWGGWWFWDPVENASFLPWLAGTALIHSLIVTEKRDAFKGWTLLLAIVTFALSLMGTFLVRSGILNSVHSFVNDPARGVFMLKFLMVVLGISFLLYAWRAATLKNAQHFQLFSRENFLLYNNVILTVILATILLGTLYPLVLEIFDWGKISVGPPYFNTVFVPFVFLLLLLMGLGVHSNWQKTDVKKMLKKLIYIFLFSALIGLIAKFNAVTVIGTVLSVWVILSTLQALWTSYRTRTRSHYGMALAHIGVGICAMGITLTSAYSMERDVRMSMGDRADLAGYHFEFLGIRDITGPNYKGVSGDFRIEKTELHAEKRKYTASKTVMTKAAIDAGLFRDIYVSLGEPLEENSWSVRLYYKPFVRWIWLGGLFMMLGGFLAAIDRRYSAPSSLRGAKRPGNSVGPIG